jgi:predicted TIM-barrel fold metal-dependent hydrolase
VSDSENGNDWDIEAIESDCRDLVECAAWTKEAANQGPVADALKELDDLAARRGLSKDAMWKNVHEVAKGALQDNELKTVVDNLSKAIESVDAEGRLSKMAEAKERVESASRRILDHLEQGKGIDALKLKRFENAMDSLKNADAAFEKPGEEKELQRIAEMGRRIADMIKRLINRILGRSQYAEEAPPPPSP